MIVFFASVHLEYLITYLKLLFLMGNADFGFDFSQIHFLLGYCFYKRFHAIVLFDVLLVYVNWHLTFWAFAPCLGAFLDGAVVIYYLLIIMFLKLVLLNLLPTSFWASFALKFARL